MTGGVEMVIICQKCGFENIDQTFYCSRCGDQIRELPRRIVEDIDQETLEKAEKARARDDFLGGFFEELLFNSHGSEDALKKDTVNEKEWRRTVRSEKKEKAQRSSSGGARQSVERAPLGGQPQDPFKPNPDARPSAVFNKIAVEETTLTMKRKRKSSE
jgi:hypothetical protein